MRCIQSQWIMSRRGSTHFSTMLFFFINSPGQYCSSFWSASPSPTSWRPVSPNCCRWQKMRYIFFKSVFLVILLKFSPTRAIFFTALSLSENSCENRQPQECSACYCGFVLSSDDLICVSLKSCASEHFCVFKKKKGRKWKEKSAPLL